MHGQKNIKFLDIVQTTYFRDARRDKNMAVIGEQERI
jgi:hypothetical protein